MKKTIITVFIFLLSVTLLSAVTISSPAATVNLTRNRVISIDALDAEVEVYQNAGYNVDRTEVLNAMINDILLEQGAQRDGYSITDSEVEQLYASQKSNVEAQAGTTLTNEEFDSIVLQSYESIEAYKEDLKNQYITQAYVAGAKADTLNNVAEPTDREIRTWYRQNTSNFALPERVRLSMITKNKTGNSATDQSLKAQLEKCYSDIKSGAITFEKGVQQYSDDTSSLSNGGDWGFMADTTTSREAMGDEFVDEAMLMEPGDVIGVYEAEQFYFIAKCTVHADPTVLTLTDTIEEYGITVQEYIRQGLLYQNSQYAFLNAYNELISDLRSQAKINIILK